MCSANLRSVSRAENNSYKRQTINKHSHVPCEIQSEMEVYVFTLPTYATDSRERSLLIVYNKRVTRNYIKDCTIECGNCTFELYFVALASKQTNRAFATGTAKTGLKLKHYHLRRSVIWRGSKVCHVMSVRANISVIVR